MTSAGPATSSIPLQESGFRPASKPSYFQLFQSDTDSLFAWRDEIGAIWRFTRNNGITEGFHNKMELITRQAFGFRNFENYRLRVKALCG